MKTKNDDMPVVPSHIEDERLVAFLDGEADTESQREMQGHLESCWDCRTRLNGVERSIENFLQLRQRELLPPEMPPSGPALELFRDRLSAHRALTPSHSLFRLPIPDLRRLFRSISNSLNFRNYSLRNQVLVARAVVVIVLVSVITGFILLSGRFSIVSASELLRLSVDAQAERMSAVIQPVVRQRIQVKEKNKNAAEAKVVGWEIWNDTVNSRVKLVASGENIRPGTQPPEITNLRAILQANGMNEHRPLSAASYSSWSDSLTNKTEDVIRGTNLSGSEVFTIKTVPTQPIALGRIVEARLALRADDYHPTELYLRAKTAEGEQEFELTESDFDVVSLKDIDPAIFSDPASLEVASTVGTTPKVDSSAIPAESPSETKATEQPEAKMPAATTDDEVEVLDLLNKVGADISEQLNVTRTADGHLLVEGLVETSKRKSEILQALSPVKNNPAIRIKIQTIDEATRSLARQNQQSSPDTIERVEVQKGTLVADPDLREYFSKNGGDTDAEIRRFASRVVNRSQSALFQASAINRLANRFTSEQLKTLEPAARAKWLNILKGYAATVRRETAALRGELQPVFGAMDGGDSENVTSDADLIRTAKKLYELAAANDRTIRSAFTLSSGTASVSAVKSQQFRRSLGTAENLAAAIERLR